jgi:hypothetical protein
VLHCANVSHQDWQTSPGGSQILFGIALVLLVACEGLSNSVRLQHLSTIYLRRRRLHLETALAELQL